jgi:regulator of cell morphogenesis and NO signaling
MKPTLINEVLSKKRILEINKIVKRVHGDNHPEFHRIHDLYLELYQAFKTQDETNIVKIFDELRIVTNHYEIPNDVCETYAMVINYLQDLENRFYA